MTFTVDDFLGDFTPPTVDVRICPRTDLRDKHRELERRLVESSQSPSSSLADSGGAKGLAEELQAVEAEMEAATRSFRFQALSRRRWRGLLAGHPPQKQHKSEGLDFNPETFPVAAIAACAVEPAMNAEQAEKLADALPLGEFERLWAGVLEVNLGVSGNPKSMIATAILRTNGASSTTAALEESPEASS